MQLDPEQKYVIKGTLKSIKSKQTVVISGLAGVGKSTIVRHLIKALPDWRVAAYTGKAASILRQKGIQEASTIHSLIYVPKIGPDGNIAKDRGGQPIFILNPNINAQGIIVDEAEMVNKEIYEDLCTFNIPLIFVGDHGQLEPIGADIHLMQNPDYKLENIHRNAGPIAYFAEFVRNGYRPAAWGTRGGDKVRIIDKQHAPQFFNSVSQIICGFNKSRVEINRIIRNQAGYPEDWPVIGEKIICLRNNKKTGIFNGMQGTVERLFTKPKNKMLFYADEQSYEVLFDPKSFNKEKFDNSSFGKDDPIPFEFCYALTAHKCVGDEFESVMVIEQKCNSWEFKRWAYTAASRAMESLIWAV